MAKTLVMIHGVGCGGDAWDVMRPGFEAAGWTCHAPTLFPEQRTIDTPPASLSDLSLQDYIDDMAAFCRRLTEETGEKPAVIGHSMGGLIAQKLTEQGLVSRAVYLTPAQPKDCARVSLPVVVTFANILLSGNRARPHKVWKTGFYWGVLNAVPKARHDEIYSKARWDSGRVYGDLGDGVALDEQTITVPTLTIAASRDRATRAAAVRRLGEKLKRAPVPGDFREYPDHAHWIVDEPGTDRVVADILTWLER
jgi:pimeloyl-ACP methyl ester carboxylesterase